MVVYDYFWLGVLRETLGYIGREEAKNWEVILTHVILGLARS